MKSFLDSQYIHLLQILRLIISKQPDVSVTILSEDLGLAAGTINGLLKQLNSDLDPYSLSFGKNDLGQINLIDDQHHQAVKTAYSNTVYQQLMITYLTDSKVFQMLLDILNTGGIDRLSFCNKMFISQATFLRY